jgi:hypothetical protein
MSGGRRVKGGGAGAQAQRGASAPLRRVGAQPLTKAVQPPTVPILSVLLCLLLFEAAHDPAERKPKNKKAKRW